MSLANHSQQSINLKQCYFEDYLMNDKTIKKALSKQIQDIQKIQPIQNQFIQNASENNKQLQMLKQKLGFKQGDLKNNENTIKKSQRKQIQKSPQNSIYSQSEQQNVLNDHVEKSLGYKQIKYEKNISAKGIQGQLILDEDTKKNMLKSKDKKFQVNQHDSIQFTSNNNVQVCDSQIEIKFIKLEWSILIFQQLNVNSYLSDNFKSKEEQIFNKLQEKGYFLLNKVNQNQNQEVFEGYQQIEQTTIIGICKQYYFAVLHDFSEEDFSLKIERACSISLNGLPLLIDYFIINQNTKIIIFQKQNYSDLDDQVIDFLIKDFKLWSYQLFDFLNSGLKNHFITDDDQNLLKSFKLHQETIINNLLQKNYYLTRYINKGGQGIIFDGFREDSSSVCNDFIFKIYLDIEQTQIEEEIKIMQLFEQNTNVINLIDHIRLYDSNTSILVLEKCQFSLYDELKIFLKQKKFAFEKLIKMIFDLLDGLIQFRIYKILHLDIKPSNILISLSGNYIYTDFGLSKVKKQNEAIKVVGLTKYYAPPEQKQEDLNIDFRSDTYSLGKTFQQIINVYKKINKKKNDFIDSFEKIVNEKMVQEALEQREDCKKIHEILILKLISLDYSEFLQGYLKKVKTIQDLYLYDECKDITYFLELNLYFHLVHLRILYENYQKNKDKDSLYLQNQLKNIATQLNKIGLCYSNLSKFEKAIKYLLKSLEIRQTIFKGNHPEIAASLNDVGYCYVIMGDSQGSLKFLLECLQMRKQLYISNYQDLAITLNYLGSAYERIGQYQISLNYQLESLLMIRNVFKGDHKYVQSSLNDCGNSYIQLQDYEKGYIMYNQSYQMNINLFKQNHPCIAINNSCIGYYYFKLQDYENSLKHNQKCLEIYQNIFGNQHDMIAQTLFQKGNIYYELGYYDKALKNCEEGYQIALKVYDENHTFLVQCMYSIYLIYYEMMEQTKREKQEKLIIDKINQQIKIKNNNYELLDILTRLNYFQENYQISQKYCYQSLKIKQKIFQKDHMEIARSLNWLGLIYQQLREYKNLLKYSLESLLIAKKLMKNNDCEIIYFYTQVGNAYKYLKKKNESLKYYLIAIQIARKQFKKNVNLLAYVLHKIGNYYNYFDEIKIALQYYLDSLEENKQFYKENNISIANTLFEIGKCYYNQQDFKNSLKYFLEYRDMRQQLNYILYDDDYFLSLSYIVKCYQFINDPFNAQNISLENYQTSINMNREEDEIQDSLNLFVKNCYNSETYQQALDLRVQNLKYEKFYQENLLRIGGLYELIGKFDLSIQYYEKLYIQSNLDNEIKCQCILRLGQGYKILEFYEIALMYLLELYDMIKNVKSPEDQIEMILNDIIFCSQKCDNLEQSQVYMQKLKKVKDCNYNPERTQVLKLTQYF